jgi:hypothetical protein
LADEDTEIFRIEVGYTHGVKPGNIVGAIANVAGLEGWQIGHVDIREDHTFVGLPQGHAESGYGGARQDAGRRPGAAHQRGDGSSAEGAAQGTAQGSTQGTAQGTEASTGEVRPPVTRPSGIHERGPIC